MVRKTTCPGSESAPATDAAVDRVRLRLWVRLLRGTLLVLMLIVLAGAAGMYTFKMCPCPHFEKRIDVVPIPPPPPPGDSTKT